MLSPSGERPAMHNLSSNLPPLIGREVELDQLGPLLSDGQARLLTLTGAGGCGKTRLALELAQQAVENFADGVWFIDLATLGEPALVPYAVTAELGLREEPGLPLVETLLGTLRSRSVLLVIDNCEHLVEACAALCETLLRGCPALRILATSRERLGVTNEVLRQIAPLAVPNADHLPEPSVIADYAVTPTNAGRDPRVEPRAVDRPGAKRVPTHGGLCGWLRPVRRGGGLRRRWHSAG
jgi:predicted ATPase